MGSGTNFSRKDSISSKKRKSYPVNNNNDDSEDSENLNIKSKPTVRLK